MSSLFKLYNKYFNTNIFCRCLKSNLQFCFCLWNIDFSVYLLPVALLECLLHYVRPAWNWLFMLIRFPKISTTKLCKVFMPPYQLFYAIFSGSFPLALFQLCLFRDPLFICSPLTDLLSNLSTLCSVSWFILLWGRMITNVLPYSKGGLNASRVWVWIHVCECLCERLLLWGFVCDVPVEIDKCGQWLQ